MLTKPISLQLQALTESDVIGNQSFLSLVTYAIARTQIATSDETLRFEGEPFDIDTPDGIKLASVFENTLYQRSASRKKTDAQFLIPPYPVSAYHKILSCRAISSHGAITKSDIEIGTRIVSDSAKTLSRCKQTFALWNDNFLKGRWLGTFESKIKADIDATTIQFGISDGIDAASTESSYWIIASAVQNAVTFHSPGIIAKRGTLLASTAETSFTDRWIEGLNNPIIPSASPQELEDIAISLITSKHAVISKCKELFIPISQICLEGSFLG